MTPQSCLYTVGMLALGSATVAQCSAQPLFEKMFTVTLDIGASIMVGQGPYGYRTVAPIEGGTVKGDNITGVVKPLGADWGLTDAAGRFMADIRLQLEMDDGAPVFMTATGVLQAGNHLHAHVRFEAGEEKYSWLNYVAAVGYATLDAPPPPPLSSRLDVYRMVVSEE